MTRKLRRILALVTDAYAGYGGIARYNRDFLSAAAELEFVEEILVLPRVAECPGEIRPAAKIMQRKPVTGRAAYTAKAMLETFAFKPELIFNGHLHHGPLAHTLAKLVRTKLISQLHGVEIWGPLPNERRAALDASDLVLCVSRDTLARYKDQSTRGSPRGLVINNTFGAQFFPDDRAYARRRFDLGSEFAILTVSRLDSREVYKGHDRIIDLLAELQSEEREIVYLVAGQGNDRERLEQRATELGVAHLVRFLGKIPEDALPDLYRAADLFALASTGEGFGIVFLEAMACGTPTIGLAVGGAKDALCDGELGMCVPEAAFADALRSAVKAPRPDPMALHERVCARFGEVVFRRGVADAIAGIC